MEQLGQRTATKRLNSGSNKNGGDGGPITEGCWRYKISTDLNNEYNILYIDTASIYPYECNITHWNHTQLSKTSSTDVIWWQYLTDHSWSHFKTKQSPFMRLILHLLDRLQGDTERETEVMISLTSESEVKYRVWVWVCAGEWSTSIHPNHDNRSKIARLNSTSSSSSSSIMLCYVTLCYVKLCYRRSRCIYIGWNQVSNVLTQLQIKIIIIKQAFKFSFF